MKYLIIIALAVVILTSCAKTTFIPVESLRVEYRDNFVRDSIRLYDSIFIREKGDSVTIERYKYLYRDKIIRDSIFKNDTVRVPYPVEVVKEVNAPLSGWQNFQLWLGRFMLIALIGIIAFIIYKFKK